VRLGDDVDMTRSELAGTVTTNGQRETDPAFVRI
jgi:hypothetical protein